MGIWPQPFPHFLTALDHAPDERRQQTGSNLNPMTRAALPPSRRTDGPATQPISPRPNTATPQNPRQQLWMSPQREKRWTAGNATRPKGTRISANGEVNGPEGLNEAHSADRDIRWTRRQWHSWGNRAHRQNNDFPSSMPRSPYVFPFSIRDVDGSPSLPSLRLDASSLLRLVSSL
jgi:hypothetical protein